MAIVFGETGGIALGESGKTSESVAEMLGESGEMPREVAKTPGADGKTPGAGGKMPGAGEKSGRRRPAVIEEENADMPVVDEKAVKKKGQRAEKTVFRSASKAVGVGSDRD